MPKKVLKGRVVSNKMDKTIVVAVENRSPHPKYRKMVARTKKFKAHDESNQCNIGDLVEILEHTPISKTKKWLLKEVLVKAD
ncbi:MAG: 30S ribosomal protein S17 [Candidatus Melainabacteria bacterium]|nr:30S ribosomal protein S17 [Candidatus Melainabacteria bacterium]